MKKVATIIAVIGLIFLTACSSGTIGKEDYSSEQSSTVTEKNEKFSLNETAVFSKIKITATQFKESKGTEFFNPENGNVFIGVEFVLENISDEEQSVSSLMMFEGYVDDIKCDYSFSATCAFDEGTLDGSVAPGKKLKGWYALEVPENWSNAEISFKENWLSNDSAVFLFNK